jgi:predicted dehydrogenase
MKLGHLWDLPSDPRPIVLIGAGGIVNDAHLPAYQIAKFPVLGIHDINSDNLEKTAKTWDLKPYKDITDLIDIAAASDAVFDLATPPSVIAEILEYLPVRATVMIQKPMGSNLAEASRILEICQKKKFTAAVNFQLRFSPMMLSVRDALRQGIIENILDLEVHLNLETPWHLFPFLKQMDRVEIAVHSIHYLDLIRSFLGTPKAVWAQTLAHPASTEFAQTRTTAILNYGPSVRCALSINHNYSKGPRHQAAEIRFDCEKGAAWVKLGLLLDYPKGEADEVWIYPKAGSDWEKAEFAGGWFPEAFIGTMSNLQRFSNGEDDSLLTSVEDAFQTMKLVEACYRSSEEGGTVL